MGFPQFPAFSAGITPAQALTFLRTSSPPMPVHTPPPYPPELLTHLSTALISFFRADCFRLRPNRRFPNFASCMHHRRSRSLYGISSCAFPATTKLARASFTQNTPPPPLVPKCALQLLLARTRTTPTAKFCLEEFQLDTTPHSLTLPTTLKHLHPRATHLPAIILFNLHTTHTYTINAQICLNNARRTARKEGSQRELLAVETCKKRLLCIKKFEM